MRNALKRFFLNTKLGRFIIKSLALLNTVEGVIHLVVAFISIWGLIDKGVYDIRIWTAPLENLIFGFFSIITGYVLGMNHHHH